MKFYKRLKMYKGPNVTFNPETFEAYSYRHWLFVKKIGNVVVFNDYMYSITTRKHQSKVQGLLRDLGITIDYVIESPAGLDKLSSAITYYEGQIDLLIAQIETKGSRAAKNEQRVQQIEAYKQDIKTVESLIKDRQNA